MIIVPQYNNNMLKYAYANAPSWLIQVHLTFFSLSLTFFNLYYPWVINIDQQGDPHTSKLEGSHFGQLPPRYRDLIVLTAFIGRDPNNCLQVKESISYLFNCLHREGSNNCLQVKGYHRVCLCFFMNHMLIYSCINMLYVLHMFHILLSNILACMIFMYIIHI